MVLSSSMSVYVPMKEAVSPISEAVCAEASMTAEFMCLEVETCGRRLGRLSRVEFERVDDQSHSSKLVGSLHGLSERCSSPVRRGTGTRWTSSRLDHSRFD